MITWELAKFRRADQKHFNFSDSLNQFTSSTVAVDEEQRRKKSLHYKAYTQLLNDTKLGIGRSLGQFIAEIPKLDHEITKIPVTNFGTLANSLDYLQLQSNAKVGELGSALEEKILAANPLALSEYEAPSGMPDQLTDQPFAEICEVVQKKKREGKEALNLLHGLIGGLDNALRTYFGLAKVACAKFYEACGQDFNELGKRSKSLVTLLKNTKHISTELSKLNIGMFGLLDNMSGVVINSNKPYVYDTQKFDIYNHQGELYLLPKHGFLEIVKTMFLRNPDIKFQREGDEILTEKAHELASDGVRGCFALEREEGGQVSNAKVTLMDQFFTTAESLVTRLIRRLK